MKEPTSMSPGSAMPAYPWLEEQVLTTSDTKTKLKAMKTLGVPYTDYEIQDGDIALDKQAQEITKSLVKEGIKVKPDREIIALIAYLQRLGTDIKKTAE